MPIKITTEFKTKKQNKKEMTITKIKSELNI